MNMMNETAVKVENLTVKFDSFVAVNGISFQVQKGEIFGFLGANGAGKTTTIRVLCGLLQPDDGKVCVAGIALDESTNKIKQKVGYMSQKFTLYQDLTVEENLDFISSLRQVDPKQYLKRRSDILAFIHFSKPLNSLVKDLPGGIKQQVALAASVLHDPEIVFLDEPTAGLSPLSRSRFWDLIKKLSKEKTIFVTTHYMDEVENCDRIALMREGEIIAIDSPAGLKKLAFKSQMYEVTTEDHETIGVDEFKDNEGISYHEIYGHSHHIVFATTEAGVKAQSVLEQSHTLIPIAPTLEDVFIELIESKAERK